MAKRAWISTPDGDFEVKTPLTAAAFAYELSTQGFNGSLNSGVFVETVDERLVPLHAVSAIFDKEDGKDEGTRPSPPPRV